MLCAGEVLEDGLGEGGGVGEEVFLIVESSHKAPTTASL